MIKPEQLFKLPQDKKLSKPKPISTREDFEKIQKLINEKLSKK